MNWYLFQLAAGIFLRAFDKMPGSVGMSCRKDVFQLEHSELFSQVTVGADVSVPNLQDFYIPYGNIAAFLIENRNNAVLFQRVLQDVVDHSITSIPV
jgi:hypothetical protein